MAKRADPPAGFEWQVNDIDNIRGPAMTQPVTTYPEWLAQQDVDHAHCPLGCEHPQPFISEETGRLICGRCFFVEGLRTAMLPCTPEVCS